MLPALKKTFTFLIPDWIYQRLIGDWSIHGFKKYFFNTGWMAITKIVSLVSSFLILVLVARYLGPENYGKLSYAQSFVSIFSVFAVLGIDQILYRNLVSHPEKENDLLGTAFLTRLFFGIIILLVTTSAAFFLNEDLMLTWLIAIMSLSFLFQPFGVIGNLFNARVLAKYGAYTAIFVSILIPILKLLTIYLNKGILFFASIIVIESIVYALAYTFIYRNLLHEKIRSWRFSYEILIPLLRDSWPLLIASLAGYIYGRIDQLMIQEILGSTSVGHYDAAVRLTEILGFLPGVIIASLFPAIIIAKNHSDVEYKRRLKSLITLAMGIACVSALFLFLLAPFIIGLLFGPEFKDTIDIIRVYVWSIIGTVAIILIQQYFIAEHKSKTYLIYIVLGAFINILLNAILIPVHGTIGAAWATVATLSSIVTLFIMIKFFTLSNKDL